MSISTKTAGIWKNLFEYVSQQNHKCCTVKNLSHDQEKEILVVNICEPYIINDFSNMFQSQNKIINAVYLEPNRRLFLALIPKNSKSFVNLFCCNMTMENVHAKFSDYGLAFEGCFNIEPGTMFPSFYQGYDYSNITSKLMTALTKNSNLSGLDILTITSPVTTSKPAFLVIDNHSTITIVDAAGLESYKPKGVNVQYVEGKRLFNNGKPFVDINHIKKVKIKNDNGVESLVDGLNVSIDYNTLQIKVNDMFYNFSDIGKKINFVNDEFFDMDNGLLVLGIDNHSNTFIVYHKHIDFYNMLLLLKLFDTRDAILLCNSNSANIIWKEKGLNMYNKTDFIGNPKKILSNIITFAG